jgi:hypothetical protein
VSTLAKVTLHTWKTRTLVAAMRLWNTRPSIFTLIISTSSVCKKNDNNDDKKCNAINDDDNDDNDGDKNVE